MASVGGDDRDLCEDLHNATGISAGRRKRKRPVLKKQLKSLNTFQLCKNTSLNSTIVKETLRTNNRALARALEKTRQELADSNQALLVSEGDKQEMQAELCVLRRVAGLKNDGIDGEVQRRMLDKMHGVRELLSKVSQSLLTTADLITQAMTECEPRLSRGSSLGVVHLPLSPTHDGPVPGNPNDVIRQSDGEIATRNEDTFGEMVGPSVALGKAVRVPRGPQIDLSMIQEQSYLMETSGIQFTEEDSDRNLLSAAVRRASRSRSKGSKSRSVSTGSRRSSRRSSRRCSEVHTAALQIATGDSPDSKNPMPRHSGSERVSAGRSDSGAFREASEPVVGEQKRDEKKTMGPVLHSPVPQKEPETGSRTLKNCPMPSINVDEQPGSGSESQPVVALQDRPITSKFAPHRALCANNTPVSSPRQTASPFKPDETEFFGRFVALEIEKEKKNKDGKKVPAKPSSKIPRLGEKSMTQASQSNARDDADFDDEATELYSYADWQAAAVATAKTAVTTAKPAATVAAQEKRQDSSQSDKNKKDDVKAKELGNKPASKSRQDQVKTEKEKKQNGPEVVKEKEHSPDTKVDEKKGLDQQSSRRGTFAHSQNSGDANESDDADTGEKTRDRSVKSRDVGKAGNFDNGAQNNKNSDDNKPQKVVEKSPGNKRRGTFAIPLPPDETQVLQGAKSKRQRKETIVLSAAPLAKDTKDLVHSEAPMSKSHRRGTFVMPRDGVDSDQPDNRRGTYFVKPKQTAGIENEESNAPNIFDEDSSILVNSSVEESQSSKMTEDSKSAETINKSKRLQVPPLCLKPAAGGSMNNTICEAEDMEFTEVLDPSRLAEVMSSKIPNPDFVKNAQEPSFLSSADSEQEVGTESDELPEKATESESEHTGENDAATRVQKKENENNISEKKKGKSVRGESVGRKEGSKRTNQKNTIQEDILSADDKENNENEAENEKGEKAKPSSKQGESSSGDERAVKKDVSAYFKRPGKICFTAGRRNMQDVMSVNKKTADKKVLGPSMRKTVRGRSKPRLLPSTSPLNASRSGPKGVFDLSLNESIPVPSSISYGQFRERHEAQKTVPAGSSNAEEKQGEDPDHGIMLVLGNGKRTKPRRERGKSVHYAHELTDEHLITPAVRADEKRVPGLNLNEGKKKQQESVRGADSRGKNAGHTPPRKSISKEAKRKISQVVSEQNKEEVVSTLSSKAAENDDVELETDDAAAAQVSSADDESPFVMKARKRRSKIAVIDDASDSEVFESPQPSKKSRSGNDSEEKSPGSPSPTRCKTKETNKLAKLKQKLLASCHDQKPKECTEQPNTQADIVKGVTTTATSRENDSHGNNVETETEKSEKSKGVRSRKSEKSRNVERVREVSETMNSVSAREMSSDTPKERNAGSKSRPRAREREKSRGAVDQSAREVSNENRLPGEEREVEERECSAEQAAHVKRRTKSSSSKQRKAADSRKARSKKKDPGGARLLQVPDIKQEIFSDVEQEQGAEEPVTPHRAGKPTEERSVAEPSSKDAEVARPQKRKSKARQEDLQQLWDEVTSIGDLPTDVAAKPTEEQERNQAEGKTSEASRARESSSQQSIVESETAGRRGRRAAQVVSYKEKSLNQKLRRDDAMAKSIYSGKGAPPIDIYKAKNSLSGKRLSTATAKRRSRHALSTITNVV